MMLNSRWLVFSMAALSATAIWTKSVEAASGDLESVWKGKTITISVGYKPGGGADVMARLLAVHLPAHVPGNPKIIVANRPGGGTTSNARDMLRRPADGTYIGQFAQTLMVSSVLGQAPDWFDWTKYIYLGMPEGEGEAGFYAVCGRTAVMKNLDDFLAGKKWRWGEISPETGAGKDVLWFGLTKFPVAPFFGYGGSAEVAAGFDRGEMDITTRCSEQEAIRYPQWFENNEVIPLFGWGELNPDKHVPPDNPISNGLRDGRWPWFGDFRKNLAHLATKEQIAAFDAMLSLSGTHVFAMPPGVPDRIAQTMQEAFWQTVNSPEYVADMTKRNRPTRPLSGPDTKARIQAIQDLPPASIAVLQQVFKN